MDDEPLEQWVRRREEERERKTGRLRHTPLAPGPHRGSHVHPDAPRLISRWDGYAWQPLAVVDDLAQAKAFVHPPEPPADPQTPPPHAPGTGTGTGRHRGPSAADRREARLRELLDDQDSPPPP
jgi:Family of unknown function (DUF6087)